MRTRVIISIILLLFACCRPQLYVDGHRVSLPHKLVNPCSIVILGLQDSLRPPDSAIGNGRTFIQGPFESNISYNKLLTFAWSAAAKLGGNLVKVNTFSEVSYPLGLAKNLSTTVYRLDSIDLVRVRDQIGVAGEMRRSRLKGLAVVHLADDDEWGHREIRLGDSLAGIIEYRGFKGIGGTGKMDLSFQHAGRLKLGDDDLDIQLGNEYFVKLFLVGQKVRRNVYTCQGYVMTDKLNFDN